jgi:uncharacterized SAM-binding protein YcdF (DUF218 family)
MFLVKKYLARIFFPLPLCCELLVIGMLVLWLSKRQRLGKILVSIGVLLLLLQSNSLIGDLLLSPLESRYPVLTDPSALGKDSQAPVRWVAVLGGGITKYSRFVEGARIHKALPGSKLLLSVGQDDGSLAHGSIEMAQLMGLRREDLIIIQDVKDTREEVQQMIQTIAADRFVLVTSASHMPRAMALFQGAGMNPLPAPTEHFVVGSRPSYAYVFPSSHALSMSERAIYEYLGLLWLRLAG